MASYLANTHEAHLAQDPQMSGDTGLTDMWEGPTELARRPFLAGEQVEQLPPSGVRQRSEDVSLHAADRITTELMNYLPPNPETGVCPPLLRAYSPPTAHRPTYSIYPIGYVNSDATVCVRKEERCRPLP